MCHTQVLPDGTVLQGGQSSLPLERSGAWIASRDRAAREARQMQIVEQITAIPWLIPISQSRTGIYDELLAIRWATPSYVIEREGGLLYTPFKVPDLIGIRGRKYLDATGLAIHRDIRDLMRYAIVNQTLQMHAWFGDYQPLPPAPTLARYSDEQLYALAKFLYALEPPRNPNTPDEHSRRGKQVFERQGCGGCHTPPLYTANKLTPAAGFSVPRDHYEKYDVLPVSVGTESSVALRSRRGTGYYKIPSLKGVWYRHGFGHGGWCESLEDWFDSSRLREDYVPTGFHLGPGPVKGHEFGLDLAPDDKRDLIAFLKTL